MRTLERIVAIAGGFIMMIVGLALGVSLVMLPMGLMIGFAGLALFIIGCVGK